MTIRILIADDHSVVRKGILNLLEDETDIQIVGEAADGDEAIELIPALNPDVLLLDMTMPRLSGIDVTRIVTRQYPTVRILIFSMHNNPDYILSAVRNGAAGYVLKDTTQEELLRAVRTVAAGDLYYAPNASSVIIKHLILLAERPSKAASETQPGTLKPGSIWHRITAREAQVLTCITEGLSNRAIAERFNLSPNTVANQRASIMRKAGVRNTVELVRLAMKEKSERA